MHSILPILDPAQHLIPEQGHMGLLPIKGADAEMKSIFLYSVGMTDSKQGHEEGFWKTHFRNVFVCIAGAAITKYHTEEVA